MNWPESYASYQITLAIAQIPDIVWIEPHNSYEPDIPDAKKLLVTAYS